MNPTYCVGCRLFHRPPLHAERSKHGYQHGEAFCLMTYASKDGKEVELVWNSRDGVTPFCIPSRNRHDGTFDSTLSHVDWHRDIRLPDYKPQPGERYFADVTPERAREFATRRVEDYWDHPEYPMRGRYATKEEAIAAILKDEDRDGAPDLLEAPQSTPGGATPGSTGTELKPGDPVKCPDCGNDTWWDPYGKTKCGHCLNRRPSPSATPTTHEEE